MSNFFDDQEVRLLQANVVVNKSSCSKHTNRTPVRCKRIPLKTPEEVAVHCSLNAENWISLIDDVLASHRCAKNFLLVSFVVLFQPFGWFVWSEALERLGCQHFAGVGCAPIRSCRKVSVRQKSQAKAFWGSCLKQRQSKNHVCLRGYVRLPLKEFSFPPKLPRSPPLA